MKTPSQTTVLVVDDEPMLCKAIAQDFQRKGYITLCASNGTEAFELVKSKNVDLILSDIRMPGGDGVKLLTDVKNFNHAIPVLMFMTGFADLSLEEAYDMGADAVFSKPFNRKSLMEAVSGALVPDEHKWPNRPQQLSAEVKIEIQFPNLDSAVQGKVISVGRGGMFVASEEIRAEAGAPVSFKIHFESEEPRMIQGDGVVRWSRTKAEENRQAGYGIEFVSLNPEAKAKLFELVRIHRTKAFIPIK